VQGDASETGVVKFVQSLNDLEETRARYPVHNYIDNATRVQVDCAIPFSSEIKFNLFVRDMRADPNGHLSVIMKGAPERILNRCTHILVGGKVLPFDKERQI
jgi:sodium/potassium-transporting ATPase subunit alpha